MGSKSGKYDVEHGVSLPNGHGNLSTEATSTIESTVNKKSRKEQAAIPKCIHQDTRMDTLTANRERVSLVWLDAQVYTRPANIDTEVQLRNVINYLRIFDRVDLCERYIKQTSKTFGHEEKLLVIISTGLAPTIIPHLHDLAQVKSIYIYGKSRSIAKAHQNWLRKYSKVKGMFTNSKTLIAQISRDQR